MHATVDVICFNWNIDRQTDILRQHVKNSKSQTANTLNDFPFV